jgi:hypothetical protein
MDLVQPLHYLQIVLSILQKYQCTLKLKKCYVLSPRMEFVGIDVLSDGNTVARSKSDAFDKLVRPTLFTDL